MQFHRILTSIALRVALVLVGLSPALAQVKAPLGKGSDAVILEMSQAFKKGSGQHLSSLLAQARGHSLEPWAAYWELRARLETATPDEVQGFFRQYAGTYQEDRLRNDWLLLLGQRREWDRFAAAIGEFRMNDDREVRCYALVATLPENASMGAAAALKLKQQWYAQKDPDDGCTLAATRFYAAGLLTESDLWRKARLALEANQPKAARLAANIISPAASAALDELRANPARFLTKRAGAGTRIRKESVVLALTRLAQSNPELAASMLENHWSVHLDPEQRSWTWAVIGKQLAKQLGDDALEYFAKARDSDLDDDHLAWKVRAALRKNQWRTVLEATAAMSETAQQESSWIYWRARAIRQLAASDAERAQADKLLRGIASVRGFYEQLALEDLGLTISVPVSPPSLSAAEKQAARENIGLQRALDAFALGLRSEAVREWNYTTNVRNGGMNDRELLAAADLACQHEIWDRCINTSERTQGVIDLAQRFPMPHKDAVLQRATQLGIDPAYVYGLIRQESRFIIDARSGVGASGLMQVMAATARWTAKKIGLLDFKAHQINDRDTNIAIGMGYLKLVLDEFSGSLPLAAAAYNAGPGRPRSWRGAPGTAPMEAAIWAENIPLSETRDYVKKVLSNTTNYAALISGQPQSLRGRLGLVGPRDAAAVVNRDLP